LDKRRSYSREKDIMAIGACIQNMLLAAYELGLGSCWLGEILNRRKDAERYLRTPKNLELISVITIGFPAEHPKSTRSVFQAQVLVLKRRS
jgi:nitroreductase